MAFKHIKTFLERILEEKIKTKDFLSRLTKMGILTVSFLFLNSTGNEISATLSDNLFSALWRSQNKLTSELNGSYDPCNPSVGFCALNYAN